MKKNSSALGYLKRLTDNLNGCVWRGIFSAVIFLALLPGAAQGQLFEAGMETTIGPAFSTFRGDLAEMVGFSELEITKGQLDTAFAEFNLSAPQWLRNLFPGIRIEVDQEISKKLTRNVKSVRFFGRFKWVGGSFTVSDPRLTEPLESRKLKNQLKAVSLSISGKAGELAEHLAEVALADATRVNPFFEKRYDIEAYVHLKKIVLGDDPLLVFGSRKNSSLDFELTAGARFTADPSPVVDLGSILFIAERLDSLMEGGLLAPVEELTDKIAVAVQNVVFGKFKDPRIVPSTGFFLRGVVPVNFGGDFSVIAGAEFSVNNHTSIKGTRPMTSTHGFAGLRWNVVGKKRN
jgi:hypothetical protein